MVGYWNRPDETAKVMTADGFFRTGDIGIMTEEGQIKIVDRKKDMISVSGFKVFPNEVEDVAMMQGTIAECAAVGVSRSAFRRSRETICSQKNAGIDSTPNCVISCTTNSPPTRCRNTSNSAPNCRKPMSARFCGARCGIVHE